MTGSTGAGEVRERILAAATAEFLDRGFERASLRHIASEAGVTTGAIYGHFASKNDLFDAIVAEPADGLIERYRELQRTFFDLPAHRQSFDAMAQFENESISELYDYIYDHAQAFLLVFTRAAGTRWEHYLDAFVDIEVESTNLYVREMERKGMPVLPIEPTLERALAEMFFRGYFTPLAEGMNREQAHAFIDSYERFFHAGYRALMEPA